MRWRQFAGSSPNNASGTSISARLPAWAGGEPSPPLVELDHVYILVPDHHDAVRRLSHAGVKAHSFPVMVPSPKKLGTSGFEVLSIDSMKALVNIELFLSSSQLSLM